MRRMPCHFYGASRATVARARTAGRQCAWLNETVNFADALRGGELRRPCANARRSRRKEGQEVGQR
jgi:hypothetical protein